ncbi:MAG: tRNA (adenosine(37)-N6)-dimethylallyltransferase MiaA [Nocardiopsaceae bacterium]|nr:tRNA (adenosine(37)-N6)-dimethylallyltransferase MiaA [Nocardiopsaceae bacterium]
MLIAIVGATATGKSDLAVDLAQALDGEVVNADSMQLYRGMDIGTAKLTVTERRGVPHHLLDVWDVTKTASVAEYQALAIDAIDDIASRGKTPVLVGGSGLYIRAALGDLDFPGTDAGVRRRLEGELAETGPAALHERLEAADPRAAAAILPSNGRRIIRALEVIEITGRPFSATMPSYTGSSSVGGHPATQVGIAMPRPELDRRIGMRVDRMWEHGFEAEVRTLEARGLRDGRTASRALGYQQLLRYIDGEVGLDQAREETARATRRFARRQESWFRRDPRVTWVPAGTEARARALAAIHQPVHEKTAPFSLFVNRATMLTVVATASERKRDVIGRAAFTLFASDGYERTSVDAVAAEVGVSKRTVYSYYGDKENLFLTTVRDTYARMLERITEIVECTNWDADVSLALTECVTEITHSIVRAPERVTLGRLLVAEAPHFPALIDLLDARADTMILASPLARLDHAGRLAIPDPARAAGHLSALTFDQVSRRSLMGTVPLPDDEVRQLLADGVRVFLRAYAPADPAGRHPLPGDNSNKRGRHASAG